VLGGVGLADLTGTLVGLLDAAGQPDRVGAGCSPADLPLPASQPGRVGRRLGQLVGGGQVGRGGGPQGRTAVAVATRGPPPFCDWMELGAIGAGYFKSMKSGRWDDLIFPGGLEFAASGSLEGRKWISTLPILLDELARHWRLDIEDSGVKHGYHAVVLLARRNAQPCVLKLTWPAARMVDEARALTAWNGRGAVLMLEADTQVGALLLERLDSGRTLNSINLHDAAEVAGRLLRRLAVPAPAGFQSLQDIAVHIGDGLQLRQERLGSPIPQDWLDTARGLADTLGADAGDRLVHADLHYDNILAGRREPWLAIDPKPVSGDPEHAVPELLWTRVDELHDAEGIRNLLSMLVRAAELDFEKARRWALVRCIDYWLWGLEHGLTEDPKRCRRIVDALT
jgi:streptomycin 6-kinase